MVNLNIKKENLSKWMLFFNLAAAGMLAVGYLIFILVQNDISAFMADRMKNSFSDFSEIMKASLQDNPYADTVRSSYPPLAILILYLPALFCRKVIHLDNYELIQTPQFWLSFCLFNALFFAVSALMLKKITGLKGKKFALFCLMAFSGGPLLFMLERGNIMMSAFAFLLVFLAYYKSPNKVKRELALVALAMSGTLKIYPLLFGVLLLKEGRIAESIRVAVYFFILFFVPFLFFESGFAGISGFFTHLGGFSSEGNRLLSTRNLSVSGLIHKLFYVVGMPFDTTLQTAANIVATVALVGCAGLALLGAFVSKNKFSVLLICALAVAVLPPISYYYCALFSIIPLTEFVVHYDTLTGDTLTGGEGKDYNCKTQKNLYLVFFILTASIVCCAVPMVLGVVLLGVLIYETVKNIKLYQKSRQIN